MDKVYTEPLELRALSCDMRGVWKPSAILTTMQETASAHSARLGLSRSVMDSLGVAWVLTRVKVEFTQLPRLSERLMIETYPTPNRHLFFPRSHIFRDEAGQQIGCANSLWVTMDLATRRIEKNEYILSRLPDNRDLAPATGMPGTIRALPGCEPVVGSVLPQISELDMNMHVNNTKYMDWCFNALGLEVMKDRAITAFEVSYDMEILPGCAIRTELTMKDDRFVFIGFDASGKRHFSTHGKLAN